MGVQPGVDERLAVTRQRRAAEIGDETDEIAQTGRHCRHVRGAQPLGDGAWQQRQEPEEDVVLLVGGEGLVLLPATGVVEQPRLAAVDVLGVGLG